MNLPSQLTQLNSLDEATAYVVQRTARLLRFYLVQIFQESDYPLSPEQWFLLFRLYEEDGVPQKQLANKDLSDHPNVTRLLDGLMKFGLIERRRDDEDRRQVLVYLTAVGQQFMTDFLPTVVEERAKLFAGFSGEELDTLTSLLNRLENNVSDLL